MHFNLTKNSKKLPDSEKGKKKGKKKNREKKGAEFPPPFSLLFPLVLSSFQTNEKKEKSKEAESKFG
jgi:hypothetical protein